MQRKPRPKPWHAEATNPRRDKRRRLKVYLPPELHRALKRHSQTHNVSMAHIIRTLVKHDLQAAERR